MSSFSNATKHSASPSNLSKNSSSISNLGKTFAVSGYILLENLSRLLQENGDGLLQEDASSTGPSFSNLAKT